MSGPRMIVPLTIGSLVVALWLVGTTILDQRPAPEELPPRIAVGRTDDGAALRVIFEGCGVTPVTRVTVREVDGSVVWEVRGTSPPSRTNFVIGQTANPMTVTQALLGDLESGVSYRVDLESDRVETMEFTLRSVPPVGVLHDGVETSTEGFLEQVERLHCREAVRLPFAGSITAQLVLILAGAAFAVVAAGILDD